MREIARALGVPVMTLYNHVANRDELSVAVVDHILGPVRVPDASEGTWRERIRALERDARQAMARYRAGGFLRSGGRSVEALRLADGVLSILLDGGFRPSEAARAFSVLYTYMLGQIELDSFFDSPGGDGEPTLERITSGLAADRDELFEFGFDAVLTGIEALLRPETAPDLD